MATDYRSFSVRAPDGTRLAAREWGNPDGAEILLIHGISQSQLSFLRQTRSALAAEFRLVSFDLRGHGESAKPEARERYCEMRPWADDVRAVIAAARLKRPILVGWSFGARVIAHYLGVHSEGAIGGINFAGGRAVFDAAIAMRGDGAAFLAPMQSPDLEVNIPATADFVRACFAQPLDEAEFRFMLALNMVVPPYVREAALASPVDLGAVLSGVSVPTLISHGRLDQVVLPETADYTAGLMKNARLSWYDDAGHAPFYEDAARFNAELAAFVREVSAPSR